MKPTYILDDIVLNSSWNTKYFRKFVEKSKHILCSITFFFQHRAVYAIMWKNMLQPDTPHMII
jgi:hypothetical protein